MDVFLHPRFEELYRQHPLVLADVGARGGLKENWRSARKHLRLLGFEPDAQEFARLVDGQRGSEPAETFFNVALHNRPGPITIHVTRDPGLTSVFTPNRPFLDAFPDAGRFDIVEERRIEADTLDHVLETHGAGDLDFIKADTQGSELYVLQGAERALHASVVGVEVEVEFTPIYTDQPLFADVDRFLRELGYLLFDVRPCYWKRAAGRMMGGPHGQIVWGDALYLKSLRALGESMRHLDADRAKSKALKAISVALLYGYADYALEIARHCRAVWTPEEAAAIEDRLRAGESSRDALPRFPGRRHMAAALRRLWRRMREPNEAWSVSDAELGNRE